MSHYKPKPQYRSQDASKYAHEFCEALQPWICEAMTGQKRHRLASNNCSVVNRAADDILCDCAQVLAASAEWEGALLAHGLAERGWPIDVELVRACHSWSCGLMDAIMVRWRNRSGELNPARR